MEWRHDEYTLTDDASRLDLDQVCILLHSTYWAAKRSRELIEKSLRHSCNFSLFRGGAQVGFARVITDYSTQGYLCDVVIAEEHRGKGIGKWMMRTILGHPALADCRIDLFTRDAQEFYRPFGFSAHKYECLVRYPPGYELS
jgi:ribosomal protein S18 acetylase RimI-like enzyme